MRRRMVEGGVGGELIPTQVVVLQGQGGERDEQREQKKEHTHTRTCNLERQGRERK